MQTIRDLLEGPDRELSPDAPDLALTPTIASDGPQELLKALQLIDEASRCAASQSASQPLTMEPQDVLQLETYDRLRFVDPIHDIRPERLPSYEQPDGPGDYLATDRERLLGRLRRAVCARRRGERAWKILIRHFGIGCEPARTVAEIGLEHDLTRERVRQIIAETLEFLRQLLEEEEASKPEARQVSEPRRRNPISTIECKPGIRLRCA